MRQIYIHRETKYISKTRMKKQQNIELKPIEHECVRQTVGRTDRQTDRRTDRETYRHTDIQTNKQTNREQIENKKEETTK